MLEESTENKQIAKPWSLVAGSHSAIIKAHKQTALRDLSSKESTSDTKGSCSGCPKTQNFDIQL